MRTTITLDEDVAADLKAEARRSGRSFKQVVNSLLRLGMSRRRERNVLEPFKVQPREMGSRPGLNYDKISELIEHVEGPGHR